MIRFRQWKLEIENTQRGYIYFCPRASFTSFEIAALTFILAGQNQDVELWQGSRSKSDFTVIFEGNPLGKPKAPEVEFSRKEVLHEEIRIY